MGGYQLDSKGSAPMQNKDPQFALVADDDLVRRSQSEDNAAFAELIGRHHTSCSKLALSILREQIGRRG